MRLYRRALQFDYRHDLTRHLDLVFNEDPNVHRYFLPGEATALTIVRELCANPGWSYEEWSQAVPSNTVAILAMARFLREQGRPEAQDVLKRILNEAEENTVTGAEHAIHQAMGAEAHALLSEWNEAKRQYQLAINQIDDVTIKRSWWFNLANIALQINDDTQRGAALQAALEVPSSDDISQRALELQRASAPLGRLRSTGAKAN